MHVDLANRRVSRLVFQNLSAQFFMESMVGAYQSVVDPALFHHGAISGVYKLVHIVVLSLQVCAIWSSSFSNTHRLLLSYSNHSVT